MKQFSLKRMALSAVALVTVGVASAAVETYDFTVASDVSPVSSPAVTVGTYSMKYLINSVAYGNRFAYGIRLDNNSAETNSVIFKTTGLYYKWANRALAILDLRKGDKITLTYTTGSFLVVGATLDGLNNNAQVVSGTSYEVTTDGYVMLKSGANDSYLSSVTIDTKTIYNGNAMEDHVNGGSPAIGTTYNAKGVTMTLGGTGSETWTRYALGNSDGTSEFRTAFPQGVRESANPTKSDGSTRCNNSNASIPEKGGFVTIVSTANGKVTIAGKFRYHVFMTNSDCSSWQDSGDLSEGWQTVTFRVKAGITYYIWNDSYSAYYNGFTFTPDFGVKIKDGAYATFGNASAHNFEVPTGLTAYAVEHESKDTEVSLKKVDYINAGQAVMISGTAGSYAFGTTASTDDSNFANNKLVAIASDTKIRTDATYKYYVYGKKGTNPVGFYPVSSTSDYTAKAGKAYLRIAATDAPAAPMLWLNFEDAQTTGVNEVRSKMEEVRGIYYNLAGQRVDNPTKGIYIVNGKKVVIK